MPLSEKFMFCRGCAPVPAPNLEDRRNFFNVTSVINLWGSPKCAVLRYFRLGCMSQSSPSPKTGRYCNQIVLLLSHESSNPHPVRKLGAIFDLYDRHGRPVGSNPHPVRKLGAILRYPLNVLTIQRVPILTQSENWAL